MQPNIQPFLFQFGAEETAAGIILGIAMIVSEMMGLARRALYGAIAVILVATTIFLYFHAQQKLGLLLAAPRGEAETSTFAVLMWLKAVRFFALATIGGLLATILYQKKERPAVL